MTASFRRRMPRRRPAVRPPAPSKAAIHRQALEDRAKRAAATVAGRAHGVGAVPHQRHAIPQLTTCGEPTAPAISKGDAVNDINQLCDVCGLPDPYRGQGDGIGSCDCPRCDCGDARGSSLCTCPPDDGCGCEDL